MLSQVASRRSLTASTAVAERTRAVNRQPTATADRNRADRAARTHRPPAPVNSSTDGSSRCARPQRRPGRASHVRADAQSRRSLSRTRRRRHALPRPARRSRPVPVRPGPRGSPTRAFVLLRANADQLLRRPTATLRECPASRQRAIELTAGLAVGAGADRVRRLALAGRPEGKKLTDKFPAPSGRTDCTPGALTPEKSGITGATLSDGIATMRLFRGAHHGPPTRARFSMSPQNLRSSERCISCHGARFSLINRRQKDSLNSWRRVWLVDG